MLTFLMLARLWSLCPSAVLQRLDSLVDPLRVTCTTKVCKLKAFLEVFKKCKNKEHKNCRESVNKLSLCGVNIDTPSSECF